MPRACITAQPPLPRPPPPTQLTQGGGDSRVPACMHAGASSLRGRCWRRSPRYKRAQGGRSGRWRRSPFRAGLEACTCAGSSQQQPAVASSSQQQAAVASSEEGLWEVARCEVPRQRPHMHAAHIGEDLAGQARFRKEFDRVAAREAAVAVGVRHLEPAVVVHAVAGHGAELLPPCGWLRGPGGTPLRYGDDELAGIHPADCPPARRHHEMQGLDTAGPRRRMARTHRPGAAPGAKGCRHTQGCSGFVWPRPSSSPSASAAPPPTGHGNAGPGKAIGFHARCQRPPRRGENAWRRQAPAT